MAQLALAPARAPRAGRELLPHSISTGGTHCLHQWEAGTGVAEGHGPLPLSHTPAKCSRIPPARHRFSPTRCFSSCPRLSRGDRRQRAAPSALGAAAAGTGLREAAEEKGQNQKTKNHPQTWAAQLQKRHLFPGQGKTRAKGQNSVLPPRRAPQPPPGGGARHRGAEPGRTGGGRGAEPGLGPESRRFLRLSSTQRSVGPPKAKFQPRFEDDSLSVLVPSPLPCVFPHRGGSGLVRDHKSCRPFGPGLSIYPRRVLNKQLFVL